MPGLAVLYGAQPGYVSRRFLTIGANMHVTIYFLIHMNEHVVNLLVYKYVSLASMVKECIPAVQ